MAVQNFLRQARKNERSVILLEGTRKVPDHDISRLHDLAALLAASLPKAVFRSGNAQGADSLFFQNLAVESPERLEYILPYSGSGKQRIPANALAHFLEEIIHAEIEAVAEATVKASPDAARLVAAFLAKGRNRLTVLGDRKVRRVLHNGEWWFAVEDLCGALMDSPDGAACWRGLARRLKAEGCEVETLCHELQIPAGGDGPARQTECVTLEGIFCFVQSIATPRAEVFKCWLAQAGRVERRPQGYKTDTESIFALLEETVKEVRVHGKLGS